MRIALVHNRLYRLGGLETRLFSYITQMRELGHSVTVITYKVGADVQLPNDVRIIRVDMRFIPKLFRDFWLDWRLKQITKKEKFDFVLSLTKTSNQDAVLAPGNHLGFLNATNKQRWTIKDRLDILSERRAFHKSRVVLAASQMMKDELVKYYQVPSEKIELLYPPTDTKRFHSGLKANKQKYRERFGCKPNTTIFSFVSVSHWRKGLPLLLEVFKQLPDSYELLVAGPNEVTDAPANVRYVGFVADTECLYAASDIFILPARYEPYGQVVSEAILCRTPVMISHMVGAQELVTPQEGRVVRSFDVSDWVKAIKEMAANPMTPRADFAQRNHLSVEDHIAKILSIAEQVSQKRNFTP
jgi:glycosyltransferase involved in cell wall biosynthesis